MFPRRKAFAKYASSAVGQWYAIRQPRPGKIKAGIIDENEKILLNAPWIITQPQKITS
jgi:hypothetical protein